MAPSISASSRHVCVGDKLRSLVQFGWISHGVNPFSELVSRVKTSMRFNDLSILSTVVENTCDALLSHNRVTGISLDKIESFRQELPHSLSIPLEPIGVQLDSLDGLLNCAL